jgi:hypothetical protein
MWSRKDAMRSFARVVVAAVLATLIAVSGAAADTLELKDGRVLQGRFLGGTQAIVRFSVNGEVRTFNVTEIVALTFTSNYSDTSAPAPADSATQASGTQGSASSTPDNQAPAAAPTADVGTSTDPGPGPDSSSAAPAQTVAADSASANSRPAPTPQAQTASDGMIAIPAGQTLLVRMIDGVDSKRNNVGDIFHASLETDLVVGNTLVARRGTDVYGRLAEAKEAGRLSGSAELELELTRMVINGRDYPVVSSDYNMKSKGRGSDTAKKVGGGAVLGAIIGAIAGGGRGAAIGAGAGSAAGAGVQVLTRGQQVKIPSETLLEFRLQQPVSVIPQS